MLGVALATLGLSSRLPPTRPSRGRVLMVTEPAGVVSPTGNGPAAETVPLAAFEALQAEMDEMRAAAARAQEQLASYEQQIATLTPPAAPAAAPNDDVISKAFDAVDEDGNGVLDLDEFRKG